MCKNVIDLDVHAHCMVASENEADSADDYDNDKHYVRGVDNYINQCANELIEPVMMMILYGRYARYSII